MGAKIETIIKIYKLYIFIIVLKNTPRWQVLNDLND